MSGCFFSETRCRDIVQVRLKTLILIRSKFIQETGYQISSGSAEYYRRYYKKKFRSVFFWTHCMLQNDNCNTAAAAAMVVVIVIAMVVVTVVEVVVVVILVLVLYCLSKETGSRKQVDTTSSK